MDKLGKASLATTPETEITLTKGKYHAVVRYDQADGIFYGIIIDIPDTIGFHGSSLSDMRRRFLVAVERYESARNLH